MTLRVAKLINHEARVIFRSRLTTNAGLLTISQYAAGALNLITSVLMARILGPTDFGLVALTIAYPTLLWSFVGTKSVSVITRYVAAFRAKKEFEKLKATLKLGYELDFFASLTALILVIGSAWWVSRHFYQQSELAWLMVAYAGSFPLYALSAPSSAALSSWERFRLLAVFEVLHPLIKLCLVASFLLNGFGVAGAVIGIGLAQASIGIIMLAITSNLLLYEGIGCWWKASLQSADPIKKELWVFFGWNYLFVTLNGLLVHVPVMLLGYLRGPKEAGFYQVATSIATVGSYLERSLGRVAYPTLSARWSAGERKEIVVSLKRWTLRIGLLVCAFLLLVTLLLPILLPLLFGQAYRSMVLGAQVMMLGPIVSSVFFWLNSFYYAAGRISLWTLGYSLYAALVIGLSWFFIERWGFIGLVWLVVLGKSLFIVAMFALLWYERGI